MSKKNDKTFKQKFIMGAIPINSISALLILFFCSFFISLKLNQLIWAIIIAIIIILFDEFTIFYFTNKLYVTNISKTLEEWKNGAYNTIEERTALLEKVQRFPLIEALETFITFSISAIIYCLCHHFIPQIGIDWKNVFIALCATLYGSYYAGLLELTFTELLCNPYAEEIVSQKVDSKVIHTKKIFGLNMNVRAVLYFGGPMFFTNLLMVLVLVQGYLNNSSEKEQIIRMSIIAFINLTISFTLALLYYRNIKRATKKLGDTLTNIISSENKKEVTFAQTNVSDQMQYSVYILNETVEKFNSLIQKASKIGKAVLNTTENLSVISKELSSTSLEQSADVKEILTTMEDTNAFSKNIAGKISAVSLGSESTKTNVNDGFEIIRQNTQQMQEINSSNKIITEGIKRLGEQINNIGDIVTIINEIADQTRIIAFNAELEAVSAGSKGHNFHIVATEIRRLANSTVESVHEIQKYIENIQTSSKKLITSSEYGTSLVEQELKIAETLESNFNSIQDSSVETSNKASEIANIVEQQTTSFNQIVITLRQISSGIEGFASSTKTISDTAGEMQAVASKLENIY